MQKKLMRSREHRVVSGVLGGFGTYLDIDPVILRVLFVLFVLVTGVFPGVIAYIIAAYLMPEETVITRSAPILDDDPAV